MTSCRQVGDQPQGDPPAWSRRIPARLQNSVPFLRAVRLFWKMAPRLATPETCHAAPTFYLGLLLLTAAGMSAQEPKPPQLTPEEQKLAAEATKLAAECERLFDQAKYSESMETMRKVLTIREKLYPASKYLEGHVDLAQSLHDLGFLLEATRSYGKALPYCEQAVAMRHKLYPESKYPEGSMELASSLTNLGKVLRGMGQYERAYRLPRKRWR